MYNSCTTLLEIINQKQCLLSKPKFGINEYYFGKLVQLKAKVTVDTTLKKQCIQEIHIQQCQKRKIPAPLTNKYVKTERRWRNNCVYMKKMENDNNNNNLP